MTRMNVDTFMVKVPKIEQGEIRESVCEGERKKKRRELENRQSETRDVKKSMWLKNLTDCDLAVMRNRVRYG